MSPSTIFDTSLCVIPKVFATRITNSRLVIVTTGPLLSRRKGVNRGAREVSATKRASGKCDYYRSLYEGGPPLASLSRNRAYKGQNRWGSAPFGHVKQCNTPAI